MSAGVESSGAMSRKLFKRVDDHLTGKKSLEDQLEEESTGIAATSKEIEELITPEEAAHARSRRNIPEGTEPLENILTEKELLALRQEEGKLKGEIKLEKGRAQKSKRETTKTKKRGKKIEAKKKRVKAIEEELSTDKAARQKRKKTEETRGPTGSVRTITPEEAARARSKSKILGDEPDPNDFFAFGVESDNVEARLRNIADDISKTEKAIARGEKPADNKDKLKQLEQNYTKTLNTVLSKQTQQLVNAGKNKEEILKTLRGKHPGLALTEADLNLNLKTRPKAKTITFSDDDLVNLYTVARRKNSALSRIEAVETVAEQAGVTAAKVDNAVRVKEGSFESREVSREGLEKKIEETSSKLQEKQKDEGDLIKAFETVAKTITTKSKKLRNSKALNQLAKDRGTDAETLRKQLVSQLQLKEELTAAQKQHDTVLLESEKETATRLARIVEKGLTITEKLAAHQKEFGDLPKRYSELIRRNTGTLEGRRSDKDFEAGILPVRGAKRKSVSSKGRKAEALALLSTETGLSLAEVKTELEKQRELIRQAKELAPSYSDLRALHLLSARTGFENDFSDENQFKESTDDAMVEMYGTDFTTVEDWVKDFFPKDGVNAFLPEVKGVEPFRDEKTGNLQITVRATKKGETSTADRTAERFNEKSEELEERNKRFGLRTGLRMFLQPLDEYIQTVLNKKDRNQLGADLTADEAKLVGDVGRNSVLNPFIEAKVLITLGLSRPVIRKKTKTLPKGTTLTEEQTQDIIDGMRRIQDISAGQITFVPEKFTGEKLTLTEKEFEEAGFEFHYDKGEKRISDFAITLLEPIDPGGQVNDFLLFNAAHLADMQLTEEESRRGSRDAHRGSSDTEALSFKPGDAMVTHNGFRFNLMRMVEHARDIIEARISDMFKTLRSKNTPEGSIANVNEMEKVSRAFAEGIGDLYAQHRLESPINWDSWKDKIVGFVNDSPVTVETVMSGSGAAQVRTHIREVKSYLLRQYEIKIYQNKELVVSENTTEEVKADALLFFDTLGIDHKKVILQPTWGRVDNLSDFSDQFMMFTGTSQAKAFFDAMFDNKVNTETGDAQEQIVSHRWFKEINVKASDVKIDKKNGVVINKEIFTEEFLRYTDLSGLEKNFRATLALDFYNKNLTSQLKWEEASTQRKTFNRLTRLQGRWNGEFESDDLKFDEKEKILRPRTKEEKDAVVLTVEERASDDVTDSDGDLNKKGKLLKKMLKAIGREDDFPLRSGRIKSILYAIDDWISEYNRGYMDPEVPLMSYHNPRDFDPNESFERNFNRDGPIEFTKNRTALLRPTQDLERGRQGFYDFVEYVNDVVDAQGSKEQQAAALIDGVSEDSVKKLERAWQRLVNGAKIRPEEEAAAREHYEKKKASGIKTIRLAKLVVLEKKLDPDNSYSSWEEIVTAVNQLKKGKRKTAKLKLVAERQELSTDDHRHVVHGVDLSSLHHMFTKTNEVFEVHAEDAARISLTALPSYEAYKRYQERPDTRFSAPFPWGKQIQLFTSKREEVQKLWDVVKLTPFTESIEKDEKAGRKFGTKIKQAAGKRAQHTRRLHRLAVLLDLLEPDSKVADAVKIEREIGKKAQAMVTDQSDFVPVFRAWNTYVEKELRPRSNAMMVLKHMEEIQGLILESNLPQEMYSAKIQRMVEDIETSPVGKQRIVGELLELIENPKLHEERRLAAEAQREEGRQEAVERAETPEEVTDVTKPKKTDVALGSRLQLHQQLVETLELPKGTDRVATIEAARQFMKDTLAEETKISDVSPQGFDQPIYSPEYLRSLIAKTEGERKVTLENMLDVAEDRESRIKTGKGPNQKRINHLLDKLTSMTEDERIKQHLKDEGVEEKKINKRFRELKEGKLGELLKEIQANPLIVPFKKVWAEEIVRILRASEPRVPKVELKKKERDAERKKTFKAVKLAYPERLVELNKKPELNAAEELERQELQIAEDARLVTDENRLSPDEQQELLDDLKTIAGIDPAASRIEALNAAEEKLRNASQEELSDLREKPLDSFVEWRRQAGLTTDVVTVDSLGTLLTYMDQTITGTRFNRDKLMWEYGNAYEDTDLTTSGNIAALTKVKEEKPAVEERMVNAVRSLDSRNNDFTYTGAQQYRGDGVTPLPDDQANSKIDDNNLYKDVSTSIDNEKLKEIIYKITGIRPGFPTDRKKLGDSQAIGSFSEKEKIIQVLATLNGPARYSTGMHEALHAVFRLFLSDKHKRVLNKAFTSKLVAKRAANYLAEHLNLTADGKQQIINAMDPELHPDTYMEERIAYAFQAYAMGKNKKLKMPEFTIAKPPKGVFDWLLTQLKHLMGVLRNDEATMQLFDHVLKGKARKFANSNRKLPLVPSQKIQLPATVSDFVFDASNAVGDHMRGWALPADTAMRRTNNPFIIQIADLMFKSPLYTGESNPNTFLEQHRQRNNQFLTKYFEYWEELSPDQKKGLRDALYTKDPKHELSKSTKEALKKHEAFIDEMYAYADDAGADMGIIDRKTPLVFDKEKLANKKQQFIRDLMKEKVKRSKAEKIYEVLVKDPSVFEGDLPFDVTEPLIKARKIKEFNRMDLSEFLLDDFDSIMHSFITQVTRHVEFSRFFDSVNEKTGKRTPGGRAHELLKQARKVGGATEQDIELASKYLLAGRGKLGTNINPKLTKISSWMMVYQNIRVLSLSTLTSTVEVMGILSRTGDVHLSWQAMKVAMRELHNVFSTRKQRNKLKDRIAVLESKPSLNAMQREERRKAIKKLRDLRTEERRFAKEMGLLDSGFMHDTLLEMHMGQQSDLSAARVNNIFFKWIGLQGWTNLTRVMASHAAILFIAKHKRAPGKHSERFLNDLNLVPKDVVLDREGNLLTTAEAIQTRLNIDSESARGKAEKIQSAIFRFVDQTMMRPNAAIRPVNASDPHYALIYHLKQYIFAFQTQQINRVVNEAKTHKNYGPLILLTSFIPAMMAGNMIRMMLQYGPEGPDWDDEYTLGDYAWRATQGSGVLGLAEPILQAKNNLDRYGGTGAEALIGPTGQQFVELGRTVLHGSPSTYKAMLNALPLSNLVRNWF